MFTIRPIANTANKDNPTVFPSLSVDPKDPDIKYTWQDVGVLDYDKSKNLWIVQQLTADARVLDENGKPVVNKGLRPDGTRRLRPNQYEVPRLLLQFMAEDPRNFAERVRAAFEERKKVETCLRYQFYVDSMPTDNVLGIDQASFKRMLDWTKNSSGIRSL